MKLRLRNHETRETLNLQFVNTSTLHDLQHQINPTSPSSVHLSLNRNDELLAPSPEDTLRSLGISSGDLIYYSLDWKLGDYETLSQQSESNKAKSDDVKSKRLSEPFFFKKIILEKSGDTSELTTLVLSVHAVMLESGFVLLNHGSDKLSFSKELLCVTLRYTLPELVNTSKDTVTLRFQNIGPKVIVYGTLGGFCQRVYMTFLDKRRFVPVIDLVVDTLKFEKESTSSFYREVFVMWRMVKDGIAIPLLIGLCDKAGLESPPCLMGLPTELKVKILELLPGVSIGIMACVCTEMRCLASDNGLWKQKCLEEGKFGGFLGVSVDWKGQFASIWRQKKRNIELERRNTRDRFPQIIGGPRNPRFTRMNQDPLDMFSLLNHDRWSRSGRGLGRRTWGQSFTPRCNLERR